MTQKQCLNASLLHDDEADEQDLFELDALQSASPEMPTLLSQTTVTRDSSGSADSENHSKHDKQGGGDSPISPEFRAQKEKDLESQNSTASGHNIKLYALFLAYVLHVCIVRLATPYWLKGASKISKNEDSVSETVQANAFTCVLLAWMTLPVAGWLSDKIGRATILTYSIACAVSGYWLLYFAETNRYLYYCGAVLNGMSGCVDPLFVTEIAIISAPENLTRNMGFLLSAKGVGVTIGWCVGAMDISTMAWLSTGIGAILLLIEWYAVTNDTRKAVEDSELSEALTTTPDGGWWRRLKEDYSDILSLGFGLLVLMKILTYYAWQTHSYSHQILLERSYPDIFELSDTNQTGSGCLTLLYVCLGVSWSVSMLVIGMQKIQKVHKPLMVNMFVCGLLAILESLAIRPFFLQWLVWAGMGIVFGFNPVLLSTLVSRRISQKNKGLAMGLMLMAVAILGTGTPSLIRFLRDHTDILGNSLASAVSCAVICSAIPVVLLESKLELKTGK